MIDVKAMSNTLGCISHDMERCVDYLNDSNYEDLVGALNVNIRLLNRILDVVEEELDDE